MEIAVDYGHIRADEYPISDLNPAILRYGGEAIVDRHTVREFNAGCRASRIEETVAIEKMWGWKVAELHIPSEANLAATVTEQRLEALRPSLYFCG